MNQTYLRDLITFNKKNFKTNEFINFLFYMLFDFFIYLMHDLNLHFVEFVIVIYLDKFLIKINFNRIKSKFNHDKLKHLS